ncbi:hypothetical protein [Colwellia sp. MB02u-9]|uniref:hypothetical protein n=1 Tax=Colwellia sp. MB02u-9 TaxID=2759823 RepID=UPI0015F596A3|nr:hypothetical protein [Colwellia sp. MB02u-9]MBA6296247.1 hypothetical protein [Colwellia sp. MB02u-9]
MKNKFKDTFFGLFFSLLAIPVLANSSEYSLENNVITISCPEVCNTKKEIMKYLGFYNSLPSKKQRFRITYKGENLDYITLRGFIREYKPTSTPFSKDGAFEPNKLPTVIADMLNPEGKIKKVKDSYSTFDAPLECEYDPDYSCQQWVNSGDIIDHLNNMSIEFTVTQEYIDAQNTARRLIITAATSLHVGAIARKIAAKLSVYISAGLTESIAATLLNEMLTNTTWYQVDLEVGDTIVRRGGSSNTTVIRSNSGNTGSSSENYGDRDYGRWETDSGYHICVVAYTNSGGGWAAQTVCY